MADTLLRDLTVYDTEGTRWAVLQRWTKEAAQNGGGGGGGGVTSITGTANQITASAATGAVTLSLPSALAGINSITSAAGSALSLATGTSGTALTIASATNGATWTSTMAIAGSVGIGTGVTASTSSRFQVQGNFSYVYSNLKGVTATLGGNTYTDTTSSGTVDRYQSVIIEGSLGAASSSTTYTDATGLYVTPPSAGTNAVMTNLWSIIASGQVKVAVINGPSNLTIERTASTWESVMRNRTGSTNVWTIGLRAGENTYTLRDEANTFTVFTVQPSTGSMAIHSTTVSTSFATGALTVSGGVGITGAVNLLSTITTGGNILLEKSSGSAQIASKSTNTAGYASVEALNDMSDASGLYQAGSAVSGFFGEGTSARRSGALFLNAPPGASAGRIIVYNGVGTPALRFGSSFNASQTTDYVNWMTIAGLTLATTTLTIHGNTASTATTNGSIVTSGGIGAAGAIYSGGGFFYVGSGQGLTIGNNTGATTASIFAGVDSIARLEQTELSTTNGGFIQYEGANNRYRIGTNQSSTDTPAISIARGSADVSLLGTTASTSTTTGALILSGGAGIAGAAYVGGLLNVAGTANIADSVNIGAGTPAPTSCRLQIQGNFSYVYSSIKGTASTYGGNTYTDTTSSGTVGAFRISIIEGSVAAASSATTYTDAMALYLTPPTNGTNVNITNTWALYTTGNIKVASATNSSSSTTGALVVSGGVGITGKIFGTDTFDFSTANLTAYALNYTGGDSSTAQIFAVKKGGSTKFRVQTDETVAILTTTEATTGGAGSFVTSGGIYSTKKIIAGSTFTSAAGKAWDLGAYTAGAPTVDGKVRVTIDGATYDLAADLVP